MTAFEDGGPQALSQAVYGQNKIHKLDDLSTIILLQVKNILQQKSGDAVDMAEQLT